MQKSYKNSEMNNEVGNFVNLQILHNMKLIYTCFLALLFLVGCAENKPVEKKESVSQETAEMAVNLQKIAVDIEGMTCEIGCARTIQSKLSKMEGVTESIVDFETRKGYFTFDANRITKDDVVAKITGVAGGELYAVSAVTELELETEPPVTEEEK
jgi:Cu+-exporting ATPase